MTFAAALLTTLAAATAAAPPPPGDYPAAAVLAAFRDGCGELTSIAAARTAAETHGWRPIPEDGTSPLAAVIKVGKDAVADEPGVKLLPGGAFEREVAGRQLYLAISGVSNAGVQSRGCRLYDFTAARPLDPAALRAWMGRAPETTVEPLAGLTKSTWAPGIAPDQSEFDAVHVVPGTRLPLQVPISGLVLTAQVLEFE
ncbi:MAG: hypothetical protein ABW203_04440 [Novosphingobium sp.]